MVDMTAVGRERERRFDALLATFPVGSLVDLGAGHGSFALRAAAAGWRVTAVDARDVRFPADRGSVEWRVQDIRETDLQGYDVIANLGLFYHLTLEDQLDLLDRARGKPMILDTHVAPVRDGPFDQSGTLHLGELVTQQGFRGRLFSEAELQANATASWGNEQSFWPVHRALVRMLSQRGWDVLTWQPYYLDTRTFFLCLPR